MLTIAEQLISNESTLTVDAGVPIGSFGSSWHGSEGLLKLVSHRHLSDHL